MMERPISRKPREHFDTALHPSHVTFDDGKDQRRNLPWSHYVEARWDYAEPDTIKAEIGDWVMVITGHNLASLFLAFEEQSLVRVRAQPELAEDREREADTFVTAIQFIKPPSRSPVGQTDLALGLE